MNKENRDIFRIALKKAEENGFDTEAWMKKEGYINVFPCLATGMVYSHEFAEKFFASNFRDNLQEMVLRDNPYEYLKEKLS